MNFQQTPTVEEEIRHYSSHYSARLNVHPNDLVGDYEDTCKMIYYQIII
jgi:hypothetical protein